MALLRIPEAVCLIHEILRILFKWIKIMRHVPNLLPQIVDEPYLTRVKFHAKAKLSHQEIVRLLFQFVKENMILYREPSQEEEEEEEEEESS